MVIRILNKTRSVVELARIVNNQNSRNMSIHAIRRLTFVLIR